MACSKPMTLTKECEEVEEFTTCQICLNIHTKQVFSCENGHVACHSCSTKLVTCANCRDSKGYPNKNTAYFKVIAKMPVFCAECELVMPHEEYLKHEKEHSAFDKKFRNYWLKHQERSVRVVRGEEVVTVFTLAPVNTYVNEESLMMAGLRKTRKYVPSQGECDVWTCAKCNINLYGWEERDIPIVEHLKHSPQCYEVSRILGSNQYMCHTVHYEDDGNVRIELKPFRSCGCGLNFRDARAFVHEELDQVGKLVNIRCRTDHHDGPVHYMYAQYERGTLMVLRMCHNDDEYDDFAMASHMFTQQDLWEACTCGRIDHDEDHSDDVIPFEEHLVPMEMFPDQYEAPVIMPGEDMPRIMAFRATYDENGQRTGVEVAEQPLRRNLGEDEPW